MNLEQTEKSSLQRTPFLRLRSDSLLLCFYYPIVLTTVYQKESGLNFLRSRAVSLKQAITVLEQSEASRTLLCTKSHRLWNNEFSFTPINPLIRDYYLTKGDSSTVFVTVQFY